MVVNYRVNIFLNIIMFYVFLIMVLDLLVI